MGVIVSAATMVRAAWNSSVPISRRARLAATK